MKLAARSLLAVWFATVPAHAQIANFTHVVVIVQENRTPDNLFQGLCVPLWHERFVCIWKANILFGIPQMAAISILKSCSIWRL